MKRANLRKMFTITLLSVMLLGTSMVVHAATPEHECSYTFVRRESYGTITAGTHSYIVGYENGEAITASCTVTIDRYADVYRCGCGDEYKETFGITLHSSCGQ